MNQFLYAVKFSGDIEIKSSLSYFNNKTSANLSGISEIEFLFNKSEIATPRLVFNSTFSDDGIKNEIKYMYIRPNFRNGHLTLGRQPVFWSFGSVLNLMDYGLGIDNFANETLQTGIDGLRYHLNIGAGNTFQIVTSFPYLNNVKPEDLGYGSRMRFIRAGHDFSLNFFYQPVFDFQDNLLRTGITYKTDIKNIGTYTSIGYYNLKNEDKNDIMFQVGFDNSIMIGGRGGKLLFVQTEYYRFLDAQLSAFVLSGLELGGSSLHKSILSSDTEIIDEHRGNIILDRELFLLNASIKLDFFSDIGVLFLLNKRKSAWSILPYYITELGDELVFRLDGNIIKEKYNNYIGGISASLNYYF